VIRTLKWLTTLAFAWHMLLGCELHCACVAADDHGHLCCQEPAPATHEHADGDDADEPVDESAPEDVPHDAPCVAVSTCSRAQIEQPHTVVAFCPAIIPPMLWGEVFASDAGHSLILAGRDGPAPAIYLELRVLRL